MTRKKAATVVQDWWTQSNSRISNVEPQNHEVQHPFRQADGHRPGSVNRFFASIIVEHMAPNFMIQDSLFDILLFPKRIEKVLAEEPP